MTTLGYLLFYNDTFSLVTIILTKPNPIVYWAVQLKNHHVCAILDNNKSEPLLRAGVGVCRGSGLQLNRHRLWVHDCIRQLQPLPWQDIQVGRKADQLTRGRAETGNDALMNIPCDIVWEPKTGDLATINFHLTGFFIKTLYKKIPKKSGKFTNGPEN